MFLPREPEKSGPRGFFCLRAKGSIYFAQNFTEVLRFISLMHYCINTENAVILSSSTPFSGGMKEER